MTTIKNPFERSEIYSETMILLYPKKDATWEQISLWLENAYSDPAWKWNGFGTVGTEGFKVALIRRPGYDDDEDESGESWTRNCLECDEDFTPSVEHARDGVCDECVSEKGKKQVLKWM